jgi:hypothetical protein
MHSGTSLFVTSHFVLCLEAPRILRNTPYRHPRRILLRLEARGRETAYPGERLGRENVKKRATLGEIKDAGQEGVEKSSPVKSKPTRKEKDPHPIRGEEDRDCEFHRRYA